MKNIDKNATDDRVFIFDTTLRDGEQTPGVNLNIADKRAIALQLEALGVDVIEAGFANASDGDFKAVVEVAHALKNATCCSLARCYEADVKKAFDALRFAVKPRIHAFIATSDIHMQYKLKMSPDKVLKRVAESVKLARSLCGEVQFSPEDASRTRPEFLKKVLEIAIEEGASIINIPDTVGYATVYEWGRLIEFIKNNVNGIENVVLGAHCHDDLGLAVANSLEAIRYGVRQVECTINGMGERAGNAALEEIVMGLHTRRDFYRCVTNIETKQIHRTSRLVSSLTNTDPSPGKAVVGANAFLHESGIHQHGVLNNPATYEVMRAEDLGMAGVGVVLGKLSGKHAFADRAAVLGYNLDDKELELAFVKFKQLADRKKAVTDKDIDAILGGKLKEVSEVYHLIAYQVVSTNMQRATAAVTLMREGYEYTEASIGSGPIDAVFYAIDKITGLNLELTKYRVKAVSEGRDALAEVVLGMRHEHKEITGRGVSIDVVEASILAYIDGLNRILGDI